VLKSRPPLDVAALRAALAGGFVTTVDVVTETTSTNADLVAAARAGAPEGTLLVAEFQSAGRGRFTRSWTSPPRAGLTFSLLVRPERVPVPQWGWLPLLTGVALFEAVRRVVPVEVSLKWPNDLLLGPSGQKGAGILAEAGAGWVVVGVGLNVDHGVEELPSDQAGSLRIFTGHAVDRGALLAGVVTAFASRYRAWVEAVGDPDRSGLRSAYEQACGTLGRVVEIRHPDHTDVGRAVAVDGSGALVVETADGTMTVSAGDVVHIRARDR
jgi:BirA family transcriptional regulator, biotin operon repressor / biotin---[acetyl-CoA-carboxylase] ligase